MKHPVLATPVSECLSEDIMISAFWWFAIIDSN